MIRIGERSTVLIFMEHIIQRSKNKSHIIKFINKIISKSAKHYKEDKTECYTELTGRGLCLWIGLTRKAFLNSDILVEHTIWR